MKLHLLENKEVKKKRRFIPLYKVLLICIRNRKLYTLDQGTFSGQEGRLRTTESHTRMLPPQVHTHTTASAHPSTLEGRFTSTPIKYSRRLRDSDSTHGTNLIEFSKLARQETLVYGRESVIQG